MSYKKVFSEMIRDAREDADLLQSDMARMIPMNQSNYSKIERGIQEPNMEQLRRICQILKLDPRYLLDLEDYESTNLVYISRERAELLKETEELIKKYKKITG